MDGGYGNGKIRNDDDDVDDDDVDDERDDDGCDDDDDKDDDDSDDDACPYVCQTAFTSLSHQLTKTL
jgi:hypothetical protein